jgi:hypothetical protein
VALFVGAVDSLMKYDQHGFNFSVQNDGFWKNLVDFVSLSYSSYPLVL